MIVGESVEVLKHEQVGTDEAGEPLYGPWFIDETVSALVVPGACAELDATRPNGVKVAYTLHFPKTYKSSLRGAHIKLRGDEYRAVGDPQGYTEKNVPGPWNRPVEVEAVYG